MDVLGKGFIPPNRSKLALRGVEQSNYELSTEFPVEVVPAVNTPWLLRVRGVDNKGVNYSGIKKYLIFLSKLYDLAVLRELSKELSLS